MSTVHKICLFFFSLTLISLEKDTSSAKEFVSTILHKKRKESSQRELLINKDTLVEYNLFFKKMTIRLYAFIKRVDTDLEYWKNEHYVEHRVPWYCKSLYRQFYKKKYHKKIALSVSKLRLLKKEACTLLGLFYEYCFYFKRNQVDDFIDVLQTTELLFPVLEGEGGLVFTGKIKKYCNQIELQYKKYKAPNHVKKRWKTYFTGGIIAGALAAIYYNNQEYCSDTYEKIKSTWKGYALDMASSTWNFVKIGIFGDPMKTIKDGLDDEDGSIFLPHAPKSLGITEAANSIKVEKDSYYNRAGKWAMGMVLRTVDAVWERKGEPSIERTRERFITVTKEVDKAFNDLQKRFSVVFCAVAMYPLYAGVNAARNRAKKIHIFDPASYHIRKLHQIVHAHEELECEQNGALYAHVQMLLDVLFKFSTDVAQTIYEDSARLRDISVPIKEKRQIVNRWYSTYEFLRI